jgi:hypothetical protein
VDRSDHHLGVGHEHFLKGNEVSVVELFGPRGQRLRIENIAQRTVSVKAAPVATQRSNLRADCEVEGIDQQRHFPLHGTVLLHFGHLLL